MRVFDYDAGGESGETLELGRKHLESEHELEDLLNANQEILLDEKIFVFGRQPSLDPGYPDLLGLDQYGNVVVFELKKGLSGTGSAIEETILSQPQNYARALAPFDYDDLNEIFQDYVNDVKEGKLNIEGSKIPGEDLKDAFEDTFDKTLKPQEYNEHQRIVILAETITGQTAENAYYLQEQGLNIQCQETQVFESNDGERFVASSVVVDYDNRQVRPRSGSSDNPVYSEENQEILERAYSEIQHLVGGTTAREVVNSFDTREPKMTSQNPNHPDSVKYVLRLKPLHKGKVVVGMDIYQDDHTVQSIRDNADVFENNEFDVYHDRTRFNVVRYRWDIESLESLGQDDVIDEISGKYSQLVELGHQVFDCSEIE